MTIVAPHLIFRREIPVMLGVFINPGRRPDQPEPNPRDWGDRTSNRADEYNPPTDKYARVVVEELMPALKKEFNISPDPELHGIMGSSSGGCAAFAVAWFRPNEFRKVITFVGSFTDIRGEYIYPELVAESEKKPIRIFMQDGRNDNRRPGAPNRDWFYQNVRLMKALTAKGYEVNYAWGIGNHGQKQLEMAEGPWKTADGEHLRRGQFSRAVRQYARGELGPRRNFSCAATNIFTASRKSEFSYRERCREVIVPAGRIRSGGHIPLLTPESVARSGRGHRSDGNSGLGT